MSLDGKVAVVTGSTSGIGLATARVLASEGVSIMTSGSRTAEKAEGIRAGIESEFGVKVFYESADLKLPLSMSGLISKTIERFDRVDILVNNAGIQHVSPLDQFPDDKWDEIIEVDLSSVFRGMKAVAPYMKKQGWGRIINISSVHGITASPNKVAYIAAKHGVVGATRTASLELAAHNVTVNAICPGWVLTPLVEKQVQVRADTKGTSFEVEKKALLSEKQPLLRFALEEDIGKLVAFLCSDSAASITGTALPIDGGWTAQ